MAARPSRLLVIWAIGVSLTGVATATSRAAGGPAPLDVATGGSDRPPVTVPAPTTVPSTATTPMATADGPTTTTPSTSVVPASSRPSVETPTTVPAAAGPAVDSGEVPMPPGPWNPVDHLPAGYVPAVDDGYWTVQPSSPQVDDRITPVPGGPYTLQGRVTDERGNLLEGICVDVDHPGFGRVVTGPDGIFRFTGPGFDDAADMPGIPWHIWDCTPGGTPDWAPVNTFLSRMTPGDTSTWFWRLGPASRLEGRVVDERTGQPVPGVCVLVDKGTSPDWAPARSNPTDTSGRFTVEGIGGWDQHARAVPCPGTTVDWQGVPQYLPFRPGFTVNADLAILGG